MIQTPKKKKNEQINWFDIAAGKKSIFSPFLLCMMLSVFKMLPKNSSKIFHLFRLTEQEE